MEKYTCPRCLARFHTKRPKYAKQYEAVWNPDTDVTTCAEPKCDIRFQHGVNEGNTTVIMWLAPKLEGDHDNE